MFARISNSWQLVKASWAVLRADRELIVFPIVSFVAATLITITFMIPLIGLTAADTLRGVSRGGADPLLYVGLFLFYLVQYTVVFYCNSALVGAALIRLQGGDPTVGAGFRVANQHLGKILGYALINATVGMILRWLSERGLLGRIVAAIVGVGWNIATYLVVPVLVVEDIGPIDAIKRSAALLRKTWGEQIVGNVSISVVFGLITFGLFLLGIPILMIVVPLQSAALLIAALIVGALVIIGVSLLGSALNGIYTAALYRFATGGETGAFFDNDLIQSAFRSR